MALRDLIPTQLKSAIVRSLAPKITSYTNGVVGVGVPLWDGIDNGYRFVKDGYMNNENVFICVRKIIDKVIQGKFVLYDVRNTSQQKMLYYKTLSLKADPHTTRRVMEFKAKNDWQEVEQHPFLEKLEQPNANHGRIQFMEALVGFLEITGNSFVYINSDNDRTADKSDEWYVLGSHAMTITMKDEYGGVLGYSKVNWRGNRWQYEPWEIIHTGYFNPDWQNGNQALFGQSPLRALLRRLQASNAGFDDYVKENSSGGLFGFIHAKNDHAIIGPEQQAAFRSRLDLASQSSNPNERIFITDAEMEWTQIGFRPAEKNVIEKFGNDLQAFGMAYGIPLSMLTNSAATRNNKDTDEKYFINNKISSVLSIVRDILNKLLKRYDPNLFIDFDLSEYPEMGEDMKELTEWLERSYWLTPNEKRQAQKYGKLNDPIMDKPLVQSSLVPLDELTMAEPDVNNQDNADYEDNIQP